MILGLRLNIDLSYLYIAKSNNNNLSKPMKSQKKDTLRETELF